MIPKPQHKSPPPPILPHSSSMPPSSFQDTTPLQRQTHRRRHSDRIRSPSDSSSSGSDDESLEALLPPRSERQASAPADTLIFPSTASHTPATRPTIADRRKKTLSDSKLESPLTARVRGGGPPSAFGYGGAGFARPSPASRRRRGSTSSNVSNGGEDAKSPEFLPSDIKRSASSMSVHSAGINATSPPWERGAFGSSPSSPISPTAALDSSSFFARSKSPDVLSETEAVEGEVLGNEGDSEGDGDVMGEGLGADMLNPRLSKISVSAKTSGVGLN